MGQNMAVWDFSLSAANMDEIAKLDQVTARSWTAPALTL